jgi:hypothetical protein
VFLFNGENPGIWSLVGGVIVVGVITLWYVKDSKSATPNAGEISA